MCGWVGRRTAKHALDHHGGLQGGRSCGSAFSAVNNETMRPIDSYDDFV